MEISPIAGIQVLPITKPQRPDSELSAVFDIENSSKPGDDSYTGSSKKAAGGEDDEDAEDAEQDEAAEPAAQETETGSVARISYFA